MNPLILMLISFLRQAIGGYIVKKLIISWVLPAILDALINALSDLAKRSDNSIDDMLVGTLIANREKIQAEIQGQL